MASISETLRAAHPDAPWLWREDWAAGRVSSAHGAQALVIWVIAVVFSGFSVPLVLQAPEAAKADGFGVWLFAALFPLASVGLLYWAAQSTLRWRRFRNLSFELSTIPGVVGGRLEGVAHLGRTIQPQAGFTLRLSCLRRRRRARKTEEETIWQEEIVVPRPVWLLRSTGVQDRPELGDDHRAATRGRGRAFGGPGTVGRAAFSVRLRQPGRKPKLLVSDLRSKADAEAIAHLLWRGVQRDD